MLPGDNAFSDTDPASPPIKSGLPRLTDGLTERWERDATEAENPSSRLLSKPSVPKPPSSKKLDREGGGGERGEVRGERREKGGLETRPPRHTPTPTTHAHARIIVYLSAPIAAATPLPLATV
jgi:hypothetical protein